MEKNKDKKERDRMSKNNKNMEAFVKKPSECTGSICQANGLHFQVPLFC